MLVFVNVRGTPACLRFKGVEKCNDFAMELSWRAIINPLLNNNIALWLKSLLPLYQEGLPVNYARIGLLAIAIFRRS